MSKYDYMKEGRKNQNKKEKEKEKEKDECPLCDVSEETIKKLRETKPKAENKKIKENKKHATQCKSFS